MVYGKPAVEQTTEGVDLNNTNTSTSCAGKVTEDENKERTTEQTNESLNSESVASNSAISDQPAVEKYRPLIPTQQSSCGKCACGNNKRQGLSLIHI